MIKISDPIREKILHAANELVLEGVTEPTNAQVLERMGKGSLSHVSPVMRQWREDRKKEQEVEIEIPEQITAILQAMGNSVWKVATELASSELKSFKHYASVQLKECEQERDEALEVVRKLEERIKEFEATVSKQASLQQKLSQLEREQTTLIAQKKLLEETLERERENVSNLQQQLVDIAKKRAK